MNYRFILSFDTDRCRDKYSQMKFPSSNNIVFSVDSELDRETRLTEC